MIRGADGLNPVSISITAKDRASRKQPASQPLHSVTLQHLVRDERTEAFIYLFIFFKHAWFTPEISRLPRKRLQTSLRLGGKNSDQAINKYTYKTNEVFLW